MDAPSQWNVLRDVDIIGDQAFDPSLSEEKSVEVDISLSVGYQ